MTDSSIMLNKLINPVCQEDEKISSPMDKIKSNDYSKNNKPI